MIHPPKIKRLVFALCVVLYGLYALYVRLARPSNIGNWYVKHH